LHLPLDQFESYAEKLDIPEDAEVVTLCHHGVRSLKAALFLRERGIAPGAKSIAGGIDLWSIAVDSGVPRYTRSGSVCTPIAAN
jgi:rhodanese-related sulfurtransferase